MNKCNIIPPIDLTDNRSYYGVYHSRDFYKGTSFVMSGNWTPNIHYFNDEYITNFVSFIDPETKIGVLLACNKSHISSKNGCDVPKLKFENGKVIGIEQNPYWTFIMTGTEGPEGPEGPEGKIWTPSISEDGIITWTKNFVSPESIAPTNIKGPKGDKGDENIVFGCSSDFENGSPDIHKIWYDPCDDAVDEFSITDFLYQAYLGTGGNLNKNDFETAFSNLSNTTGFKVQFAKNFEDLGKPTKNKLGIIWMIPANHSNTNNLFDEYIVIHSPNTTDEVYIWEKWGAEILSVDLSNYYTKTEIDKIKTNIDKKIEENLTIWNDVNQ